MTSRISLLSSTALAAAAIVFAGAPSSAASLDALEKRVKALEKAGAGKSVSRSKKTMKLTVSGHLNRMVQLVDNGVNSEVRHVTNQQSRSRVRWVGTGKLTDDISVRTLIEFGNSDAISSGQSIQATEFNGNGTSSGTFDTRHIDLQLTSKSMGKLYLGHGSDAADGAMGSTDLSGTLVALSGAGDEDLTFGGENFVNAAGTVILRSGLAADEYDGTREDRIRYDTPSFGGFKGMISHANDDTVAFGMRYGGSFSGLKVKAHVSRINNEANAQRDVTSAAVGILLPMGLSVQVAAGERDLDTTGREDPTMMFYRVGYRFKGSEMGETRLAISYSENEDLALDGDKLQTTSVAIVQIIEPLGSELYASYNNVDLERTGVVGIEDIDVFTVGMRVKF